MTRRRTIEILAVAGLTLLALALRLYLLREIPFGLHNDEAANGLDAMAILNGRHSIFFPANSGREALFLYLQAGAMALVGMTPYAVRLPAAIIGALTVPAVYWMVRETFATGRNEGRNDGSWLAFWTAAFVAISYWHLAFSRLGYRGIMVPLTTALAFAFFWRSRRKLAAQPSLPWFDLILCGTLLGIGLNTYIAARIAPLLVAALMAVEAFRHRANKAYWQREVGALIVIAVSAGIVFLPLAIYFVEHPGFVGSRAAAVSILNPAFNGGNPLRAAAGATAEFVNMFLTSADLNLRHNPAQRPLLGLVLGGWAILGLLGAGQRRRQLPYLFVLLWVALFALPALLSLQGMPHSLRAIGMIPGVFLLIVLGMTFSVEWFGQTRQWPTARIRHVAALLPLPFVLFSGVTAVQDYFGAWQTNERLPFAFHASYVNLMQELVDAAGGDTTWVIPLASHYFTPDTTNYTMEFAFAAANQQKPVDQQAGLAIIVDDPLSAPGKLTSAAQGRRYVNLVEWPNLDLPVEGAYSQADAKGLFPFLLEKSGTLVDEAPLGDIGYLRYQIAPETTFQLAPDLTEMDIRFGDAVRLTGVDFGPLQPGHDQPDADKNQAVPSGGDIWAVLRWEAVQPLSARLTAGLRLQNVDGYPAGKVDGALISHHYPYAEWWPPGEESYTYHTLASSAAIVPDQYDLTLLVADAESGRSLLATAADGEIGTQPRIGRVDVTHARTSASDAATAALPVTPNAQVPGGLTLAAGIRLLGYDLIGDQFSPGDRLPLTLYWQAARAPGVDSRFQLALTSGQEVVAETARAVGGERYPTSQWLAQEIVRDWQDFHVPVDLPSGDYTLMLIPEETPAQVIPLAEITVAGRPRRYSPPDVVAPLGAQFGAVIELVGLTEPVIMPAPTTPPEAVPLLPISLVWHGLAPNSVSLVRSLQLLTADGRLIAQQDGIPCAELCPTNSWLTDEYLLDSVDLPLPTELDPGDYQLMVGWYDPATLTRIPALTAGGAPLAADLAPVATLQVPAQ